MHAFGQFSVSRSICDRDKISIEDESGCRLVLVLTTRSPREVSSRTDISTDVNKTAHRPVQAPTSKSEHKCKKEDVWLNEMDE